MLCVFLDTQYICLYIIVYIVYILTSWLTINVFIYCLFIYLKSFVLLVILHNITSDKRYVKICPTIDENRKIHQTFSAERDRTQSFLLLKGKKLLLRTYNFLKCYINT